MLPHLSSSDLEHMKIFNRPIGAGRSSCEHGGEGSRLSNLQGQGATQPPSLIPASLPPGHWAETRSLPLFPKQELNEVLICFFQAHSWVKSSLRGQPSLWSERMGSSKIPTWDNDCIWWASSRPWLSRDRVMGWGERWWQGQLLSQKPSFSSQPSSLGSSLLSAAAAAAADNSTKLSGLKSISNQTTKERKQTSVSLYYAPDIVLKGLHGISNRICKTEMWNARKLDF